MTKIVINKRIGGFGLTDQAIFLYGKLKNLNLVRYKRLEDDSYIVFQEEEIVLDDAHTLLSNMVFTLIPDNTPIPEKTNSEFVYSNLLEIITSYSEVGGVMFRSDPCLVEAVKILGDKANAKYCELKIVEIPDDVDWYICESDNGTEYIREKSRSWD